MRIHHSLVLAVLLSLGTTGTVFAETVPAVAAQTEPAATQTQQAVPSLPVIPSDENGEVLDPSLFKAVKTVSGETLSLGDGYAASQQDQNALYFQNGANITVTHSNISKLGHTTSIKGSRLNGQNALVLSHNSTALLEGCVLNSQADGAAAVFAAGPEASVKLHNTNVRTSGLWSPGLAVQKEGKAEANNVNIGTTGAYSAALSAGGGKSTVTVTQSTLSTTGVESPIIYSGGDIAVSEVRGGAGASSLVVVEGSNVAHLEYADFTGGGTEGILLYRQLSKVPDADHVTRFSAKHASLRHVGAGPMFFVTNTNARIYAEMTGFQYEGKELIRVGASHWGNEGQNGAVLEFIGNNQPMSGDITVDELSSVTMTLQNESHWYGSINEKKTAKSVKVGLDGKSTWSLSGDAHVNVLIDGDTTLKNITGNGYCIFYDSADPLNHWLEGKTFTLTGGGAVTPEPAVMTAK